MMKQIENMEMNGKALMMEVETILRLGWVVPSLVRMGIGYQNLPPPGE